MNPYEHTKTYDFTGMIHNPAWDEMAESLKHLEELMPELKRNRMTHRKVTSFRLSPLATRQLAELTSALALNNSEVISTALDRMYQQEIANNETPNSEHVRRNE
jgi:hypothetical protein